MQKRQILQNPNGIFEWIVEWISYDHLDQVTYFIKEKVQKFIRVIWIDGRYNKWDAKEKQLIRAGTHEVILGLMRYYYAII